MPVVEDQNKYEMLSSRNHENDYRVHVHANSTERLLNRPFAHGLFHESGHLLFGLLLCALGDPDQLVECARRGRQWVEFEQVTIFCRDRDKG